MRKIGACNRYTVCLAFLRSGGLDGALERLNGRSAKAVSLRGQDDASSKAGWGMGFVRRKCVTVEALTLNPFPGR